MEFSETWNVNYQEARNPLSPEQAHARHDAGETYTVLVPDAAYPTVIIEVTLSENVVKTYFLDEQLRVYARNIYARPDRGRLFLEQTRHAAFAADDATGKKPLAVTQTAMTPAGDIYLRQGNPPNVTESEGTSQAPTLIGTG